MRKKQFTFNADDIHPVKPNELTFTITTGGELRKDYQMDQVFTEEVIICTKKRRGDGKTDPIRVITEVFTKDGKLIAEYDPK